MDISDLKNVIVSSGDPVFPKVDLRFPPNPSEFEIERTTKHIINSYQAEVSRLLVEVHRLCLENDRLSAEVEHLKELKLYWQVKAAKAEMMLKTIEDDI
jgi:hypothetical protein